MLERSKCWRDVSFSWLVCIFPGRVEMESCRRFVEILWSYTDREQQDNAPECPNRRPLAPLDDDRSASVQFEHSQSMFYVAVWHHPIIAKERIVKEFQYVIGFRAIQIRFSLGFTAIATISCRYILYACDQQAVWTHLMIVCSCFVRICYNGSLWYTVIFKSSLSVAANMTNQYG